MIHESDSLNWFMKMNQTYQLYKKNNSFDKGNIGKIIECHVLFIGNLKVISTTLLNFKSPADSSQIYCEYSVYHPALCCTHCLVFYCTKGYIFYMWIICKTFVKFNLSWWQLLKCCWLYSVALSDVHIPMNNRLFTISLLMSSKALNLECRRRSSDLP